MLRIVRSQPRTASLLSGNSVLRADFFRRKLIPQQLPSVFQRFCAGQARGEPPAMLPAARVRHPSSRFCVILLWIANQRQLAKLPCAPLNGLSRRPINSGEGGGGGDTCAVTGCPVGFEIHWYRMLPFCCCGWSPGGTYGTNLVLLGPATCSGMVSAPSRRYY